MARPRSGPRVLITDGEQRAALALVRSLGAAGYRCVVCSASGRSLAGVSRYAEGEHAVPDAGDSPSAFSGAIHEIVRRGEVQLVFPVSEASLLAILPERDQLGALLPFPDLDRFGAICDKQRVLAAAEAIGIRVPRQVVLGSPADAALQDLELPLVLKPVRSVFTHENGSRGKATVRWVRIGEDITEALNAIPRDAYPILVQEAIEGPGIGVFLLLHEGQVIAQFAHRRIREKPPSGGVSVLRESEPLDDRLLASSVALLREFDWSGVAMVEYKLSERSGVPYLMEVNGRFWGSLQLAIDAGVDFPVLLASVARGQLPAEVTHYRHARSRWLWGDVDHLIAIWRDPSRTMRERLQSLAGWITAFGPGSDSEIFRWTDPQPFAHESREWLRSLRG